MKRSQLKGRRGGSGRCVCECHRDSYPPSQPQNSLVGGLESTVVNYTNSNNVLLSFLLSVIGTVYGQLYFMFASYMYNILRRILTWRTGPVQHCCKTSTISQTNPVMSSSTHLLRYQYQQKGVSPFLRRSFFDVPEDHLGLPKITSYDLNQQKICLTKSLVLTT